MAVNLKAPKSLKPIAGITLGSARALGKNPRGDMTVMAIEPGASVAGVFTTNAYAAPPVQVCKEHLADSPEIRALVINAKIANAGTLGQGLKNAYKSCQFLSSLMDCQPKQILPFSTGVIMQHLPMDKYKAGLEKCVTKLSLDNWLPAARAIMTTDTIPKGLTQRIRIRGKNITITGIAKGSGMIDPQMATMLAFIATDAAIPKDRLQRMLGRITEQTFNTITVDGDQSTNDSFMLIATGKANNPRSLSAKEWEQIEAGLQKVAFHLAESIVRDGEGATRLLRIRVEGGKDKENCKLVANAVANSPLIKTALHAGDANVGRLLMAIGKSRAQFDPEKIWVHIGKHPVILNGGIAARYCEKKVSVAMQKKEVEIDISIGKGPYMAEVLSCDLSAEYIKINASYRRS